ncbi:acyltransferase [Sphingobium aromaticiconvertens]|uniref:acyltransferase family protein n=1 Tax=Sphingobium aromaticiconvertens TaxID=365341 RepID=UPI0030180B39
MIRSVQYWRAIAALTVVIAHILLHPMPFPDPTYRRLGSFGVLLFFVISGFIMVYTTGRGRFDPADFLRRRIERVAPLYWLVTFAVAMMAIVTPSLLRNTTFSFQQLLLSCLFIPYARADGEIVPLMKLGWSLNYEIFFYILFATTFRLTAVQRVASMAGGFLFIILLGQMIGFTQPIAYFYTQPVILSFCVGMGIGLCILNEQLWRKMPGPIFWAILAALLFTAGFMVTPDAAVNMATDACFTLASAAMLLFGLRVKSGIAPSPVGLFLGDISYAIYLVHMYVVAAVALIVSRLFGAPSLLLTIPLTIGITIAVSGLVHHMFEKPVRRWFRAQHVRRTAAST